MHVGSLLKQVDISGKTIVCSIGGGFTSTVLLPEMLERDFPNNPKRYINCVLPNEHPSTWELIDSVERNLGIKVEHISFKPGGYQIVEKQDRTSKELFDPFDIFDLVDFVGNSRRDPCSSNLKRGVISKFVKDNFDADSIVIAVGIHADEIERMVAIRKNWENAGYSVFAPISTSKTMSVDDQIKYMLNNYGVSLKLYELGFEHNNCHGACVKAGQKQWAMLWHVFPDVYTYWEEREQQWIENHDGKAYPFLKKTINKEQHYLTLKEFRIMLEEMFCNGEENFITKAINELPGNPPCMWCSSI